MGRPPTEIDRENFEKLCEIQATEMEIAGFFRCDDTTIWRWCIDEYGETFADVHRKLSAGGKASLRRQQFQNAVEKNNPTMQIWLGKQYLGQRDHQDVNVGSEKLEMWLQNLADRLIQRVREENQQFDGGERFPIGHGSNSNGTH